MNIRLLCQGFNVESPDSVGYYIVNFLADRAFYSFTAISAFASEAGIRGIAKHINEAKDHLDFITIVVGIDQNGTSKEALDELLALNVNTFIFYQPATPIFHPKIYLFEGVDKSELIIGSSNLTTQGLFTNVEASLLVSIDNSMENDRQIIEQLKNYFKGVFDFSDPNLKNLSEQLISDLVTSGLVPTEAERKTAQGETKRHDIKETENLILQIFPKRATAKIPSEFRGARKAKTRSRLSVDDSLYADPVKGALLWESGKLTERTLNIPKGKNTNPTGSMYFTKGKNKDIDQRHYFRETVFSSLQWKKDADPSTSHLERAEAVFHIVVDGRPAGKYSLALTHNTRKDSRSYKQSNSMTQVSWGEAKKVIAKDELIGKTVKLFKHVGEGEFTLDFS